MGREPTLNPAVFLAITGAALLVTGCGSQAKPAAELGRTGAVATQGKDSGPRATASAAPQPGTDLADAQLAASKSTPVPGAAIPKSDAGDFKASATRDAMPAKPRVALAPAKTKAVGRAPDQPASSPDGVRSTAVPGMPATRGPEAPRSGAPSFALEIDEKKGKSLDAPEAAQAADAAPAAPVPPSAPKDTAGADASSPWDGTSQANPSDYTIVNVFFGTDRKAMAESAARVEGYDDWFHLTAICAVVTIVFALILVRYGQRPIKLATCTGLSITLILGAITTMARLRSEELNPGNHVGFGNDRGDLQVGTCQVSVPKYHEVGVVERPSILHLEFKEDPRKHVVLMEVEPQSTDEFQAALQTKVRSSMRQEAFVFVHGYNVTFEDAARRTAQLAYDLKFDGAPIFFSWPSQGGLLQYAIDETNVAWTVPHLKDFMVAVARKSGAKSVHLIAHSMGNRALTSALMALAAEMKGEPPLFREVVLTAPDIDADVFKRDIAPAITRTADRVTLYASSNDEALAISKRLHGYPRAGESGKALVVVDGVDTIDVSNVDTSLVGHSYYGSNDTVLADLFYVLTEPKPCGQRRWLQAVPLGSLVYWVFQHGSDQFRSAGGANAAVR